LTLRDIPLKSVYRSGEDNILTDFYIPCLGASILYERAVGFFSSSILVYAMSGITELLRNGGEMRLIIGYPLDNDEFEVLESAQPLLHLGKSLTSDLDNLINSANTDLLKYRLKLFFLMTVTGKLKIKFAYRRRGMYHEKIGILHDSAGNKVLFQGSANETTNAVNPDLNFESISIYRNWAADIYIDYAKPYESGFERIWNGTDPHIKTLDMPGELYSSIHNKMQKGIEYSNTDELMEDEALLSERQIETYNNGYPIIPAVIGGTQFKPFKHQMDALRSWSGNEYQGIFKLATGAGKTITAMYAVAKVFESNRSSRKVALIVAVPYIALAEQWIKELKIFNMNPIPCYGARDSWESRLNSSISQLNFSKIEFFSAVVVNQTLKSEHFQGSLSRLSSENIFFIGDECHHHASPTYSNAVPASIFKIGLSATPYSDELDAGFETDPVKIDALNSIYGGIVSEYTLANALGDGVLTPYNYHINFVHLTESEMHSYTELSKEIAKLLSLEESELSTKLKDLIRRRNRIISNASQKLSVLKNLLEALNIDDKKHTLIYAGEGKVLELDDEHASDNDTKQLRAIADVMMNLGWKVSRFTAEEKKNERLEILNDFKEGNIDALVSMKVLDEGIDIPACERAFILASTTNSRQFIQRRGRILRKSEGKKVANIYDFVVVPRQSSTLEGCFVSLVRRELYRVMEFVKLSKNRDEGESEATDLAIQFGLEIKEF
jgi:superfamily II DNA or RNA helicase